MMHSALTHRPKHRSAAIYGLSAILGAFALLAGGCLHEERPPDIAIVDLDAVARQLGRMEAIEKQLNEKRAELTAELKQSLQELQENLRQRQAAYEGQETPAANAARKKIMTDAAVELERLKQSATQKVNQLRQSLILAFRQETLPAVRKIARERNVRTVFTATSNVVWADETLDITSALLAEMGGPPKK
ncbi:MAG: hypothetical protein GKR94_24205 [Gammaproteobacteria bacterium]|nr:hypothetical protein [Gammaproteobacteria bacterium]